MNLSNIKWVINLNIEISTYDVMYKLLKKEPYLNCLQSMHESNVARLRKKQKISIAFQISCLSEWIGDELVYKFLRDERFDVKVIIVWQTNTDFQEEMSQLQEHFSKTDIPYCFADGTVHPGDFDIVFYTSPYLFALQNWGEGDIPLTTLVCYIPDGIYAADIQNVQFNLFIHNISWRNYVASPAFQVLADKYCDIGHYGMIFAGYSKLDGLYEHDIAKQANWKIYGDSKKIKKIIYAPHHSINEVPYHSTFFMNYKYILEYAKQHKETTSWIFKPHPLLRISAVRNGIFNSMEEFDAYCREWDDLPNGRYVTGEYMSWFATSDCMIFDSMSFMSEYLYVNKPCLFLLREKIHLNEFGQAVLEVLYKARGDKFGEIRSFIESLSSQDPKKYLREKFFVNYLEYYEKNGKNAATYMYEDIVKVVSE